MSYANRMSSVNGNVWKSERLKKIRKRSYKGNAVQVIRDEKEVVRDCPGTSPPYICCGYKVIDIAEGCHFDCNYCILKGYLERDHPVVIENTEEIVERVRQICQGNKDRLLRFGTGELSDSFGYPVLYNLNVKLINNLLKIPNAILELKTKSIKLDSLPPLNEERRVVVSWSVNSEFIASKLERKTPGIKERVIAAKKAVEKGYPVGFHFDPVVYYPGWKRGYKKTAELILKFITPENIAWISMGGLRFPYRFKEIYWETCGEFVNNMVKGGDGKMRYNRFIRTEMYSYLHSIFNNDVFSYFCMESPEVWKAVKGFSPSSEELDIAFSENFRAKFLGKRHK